jgi:hypothetical protein
MKNSPIRMLLAVAVTLSACDGNLLYGRADEPSIVFSQPLGQTVPGDPTQTQIVIPQGIVSFTFDVPDVPLAGGSKSTTEGPLTVTTSMRLNQASVIMTTTGGDFNGLDQVTMTVQSGANSTTLATYTKDPAHLPGTTLVLQPAANVELLDYLAANPSGGNTVTISISGTGKLPASNWTADIDLDLHIKATAGWP